MVRKFALMFFCILFYPLMALAQMDAQFVFNGQNAEKLQVQKQITEVIPEVVQVPSTCTRQVPVGETEVCRNETRYRQECSWIPSYENCWNDTDRICRPVTRTRQECSNGPSRQVCTQQPSRQVCNERPTRNVCTTRPDGRQHCTTVGGGQHCTTVGGGESCHSVPGERTCRTVSYSDRECENVSRRRCETIPGRNDCRDTPYSQRVCGMEMQYRTESYACTKPQTINRTTVKDLKGEINVQLLTNGLVEEFPVQVSIKEADKEFKTFNITVKLLKEPGLIVVLNRSSVKVASATDKEIKLEGQVVIEVLSKEMLPIDFPTTISSATIDSKTNKLTLVMEGAISGQGSVEVFITHKGFLGKTKMLAELKADYPGDKIELGQVGNKAALSIDLKDSIKGELKKKKMKLKLKLSSTLNLQGEILNAKKPDTSKLYEGKSVVLK